MARGYQRFIPREELGDFASWRPDTIAGELDRRAQPREPGPAAPAPAGKPAPAEPSAAEWAARVQAARQAGYQDGYRDGLAALENFKSSFASQAMAQVGALLEAFDRQFQALDAELSRALAESAVALARQVLKSELSCHPDLVARVAADAVGAIMLSARQITVQVHPDDLPLVAEGAAEALERRGARLVSDPALERGGVLVHSDVGSVDARLGARWAHAAAALAGSAAARALDEPAPGAQEPDPLARPHLHRGASEGA